MAKQITHIEKRVMTQAQKDAESVGQIMGAVAQQKEALMILMDIVGELHASGALELMRGMLKARTTIGVIGISQLNNSGAQHLIRNGFSMVQFLASLDPARMSQVLDAVGKGLQNAQPGERRIGVLGLMGTLRDPEVNASLSTMINFLRGMGQGLPHVH